MNTFSGPFYESLFENNQSIMLLIDPASLLIADANRAACSFYGYSKQQMQQMPLSGITRMAEKLLREDLQDVLEKKGHRYFLQHILADGSIRDVEILRSPVVIDRKTYVLSTILDITHRKEEEQTLQKLYRATLQSERSIIITDPEGIIEFVNPFVQKLTGYTSQEIVGQHTRIFKSGEHPDEVYQDLWKTLNSGNNWQGRLLNRKKNGELYWELASITPIRDDQGNITHFAAVKEDITQQVRMESLEQEVALANQTARFRQKFLATMSHEIRTPVTGIMGMTEILGMSELDDHQRDHLATLQQSVSQLRKIINQVLEYSSIEAGKMQLKPCAFATGQLEQNARGLFTSLNNKQLQFGVEMDASLPVALEADDQRVEQIISNLLGNAIKYTPEGRITMTIGLEQTLEDDMIVVKVGVRDTGPGISELQQQQLFKPFGQLYHEGTSGIESTGLGLSISKELAQLMGGSIGVESQEGQGSLFWFTFRARALHHVKIVAEDAPPDKEELNQREVPSARVLLVEDVRVNQKVFRLMLGSLGHQVEVASNGQEALDKYREGAFDLILMDIQMPVMDGVTAMRQLRQRHAQLPPIAALSANALEGDREKYMALGMDDYLTKPLQMHELRELIARVVGKEKRLAD